VDDNHRITNEKIKIGDVTINVGKNARISFDHTKQEPITRLVFGSKNGVTKSSAITELIYSLTFSHLCQKLIRKIIF